MRLNRGFIICIVVFIALVFLGELRKPNHFVWEPTFHHTDKQPFGCFVTDSLLSVSLPKGYTVTDKTFYQLSQEDSTERKAYVVIGSCFSPSETEMNSIVRMLRRGDNVMLVSGHTDYELFDSILGAHTSYYGLWRIKHSLKSGRYEDFWWEEGTGPYKERKFSIPSAFINGDVHIYDTTAYKVFASTRMDNEDSYYTYNIAAYRTLGKGRLIFCATPLLFTNYAMLETDNEDFVFRMFSLLGDRPVVRIETGQGKGEATRSPLTYFLNHEPLKWAVYLTALGIMLYFVFTARRRQRVIPVIKDPENKSLEFVQLIGTLYHQQHDNTSLVRKKYMYFADRLRREIMADIGNPEEEKRNAALIAENTGMSVNEVEEKMKELRTATETEGNISDRQMMRCIDIMNEITRKI